MKSSDEILIRITLDIIDEIFSYLKNHNCHKFSDFNNSSILKRATTMCIISLNESIENLSYDFKKKYNKINYREFKSLRNIAAHKYGSINFEMVWDAIMNNLPKHKRVFGDILKNG